MNSFESVFQSNFKSGAYSFYSHLRETEPVFAAWEGGEHTTWIVSGYEDVLELLKTQSFIKNQSKVFPDSEQTNDLPLEARVFQHMMLDVDPPDHTRLRKLVQPYFNPKRIQELSPRIEAVADQLIDEMKMTEGPVDLINEFAFPLPIIVISELLGVPSEDREKFRRWSNTIVSASDNMSADFQGDVREFIEYLTLLFKDKKENPKEDLISNLILHEEEGEQLTEDELYSMIVLLIIAGHETTVNLIGNGMYALFEHPRQLEKLRKDHTLIETAIEESLRFYSPVDFSTARWSADDMDFKGKSIKKGDMVLASISSANRDERKFEGADTFDVTRKPNPHMAFGYGIHFCLGAPLARLEGKIAFEKLLRAFPNMTMAGSSDESNWRDMFLLRGLKELPVHLYA
ncbi:MULTISPECIES: cytochrome P450 family protein [Bacillaceae]|uniref:cytochrome P450 family protein n=1 Tax=Bacillaceae TaxID=186817 RepID=UPI001C56F66D|nr:cytochrome P450 [Rossellomorea sp. YZS02]MBW3111082.1 cytochrome P450 [Bacillus sp. MCCB 382]MDX8346218.1 cytochrome P450 [Rossellomorea sp. YZS02]